MRSNRIESMQRYIADHDSVTLEELSNLFKISVFTVRRDVNELTKSGRAIKVYGGVKRNPNIRLIDYDQREEKYPSAKRGIGAAAAQFLSDGDIVFLDSGTTVPYILDHIGDRHITIVTANMEAITRASRHEGIRLIVLPGVYERLTNSICGAETVEALQKYNFTKAFLGASGFSAECGATHNAPWEYEVKRLALKKAKSRLLLADSAKLGSVTLLTYANAGDFHYIVTDRHPDDELCNCLLENGVKLVISDELE